MFKKVATWVLPLLILSTACAPALTATPEATVSAAPPVIAQPAPSIVPSSVPTTVVGIVPKQRDLIFVEFFAVT